MIACVYPALFFLCSLAREFPSPPQLGCLHQRACPRRASLRAPRRVAIPTSARLSACMQREHGWHSNWLKQPAPQLFGEPWWSLPKKFWSRNRGSTWAAVSRHCPIAHPCHGHGSLLVKRWMLAFLFTCSSAHNKFTLPWFWGVLSSKHQVSANISVRGHKSGQEEASHSYLIPNR